MTEFQWSGQSKRYGLHVCDVDKTLKLFDKLAEEGRLDAENVLAEARHPKNPLHKAAGWHWGDDATLAEKARLGMASMAISGLKEIVVVKIDGETMREPVAIFQQQGKVTVRGGGEVYRRTADLMRDPFDRAQLLTRLLAEIRALDRAYAALLSLYPAVAKAWVELRGAIEKSIEPPAS